MPTVYRQKEPSHPAQTVRAMFDSAPRAPNDPNAWNDPPIDSPVPSSVVAPGHLPSLRYRALPEPIPLRRMIGPGIILAGMSLGSGEFVLWPYITYQSGFVFFWACIVGVTTQYFLNMEISRWTLATGESAMTGFSRLSRYWAWLFLVANVVPYLIPAWAKGAAEILSWLLHGQRFELHRVDGREVHEIVDHWRVTELAIGGMWLCGIILTAGPIVYKTVEKLQFVLVALVMILTTILGCMVIRWDAVVELVVATVTFGYPNFVPQMGQNSQLDAMLLLGAIAFAGAGGTLNLGQSNYIKDKGYAMGKYIGRITSPITGQEEAISELGYHFAHSPENMNWWKIWWRRTGTEHFLAFYLPCVFCLVLLALISYSLFYTPEGILRPGAEKYGKDMNFIYGQSIELERIAGPVVRLLFLVMGVVVLFTTELGILDACSRISTDIVKVNWLRENSRWSESKLYYIFLWGTILAATLILLLEKWGYPLGAFRLFKLTAGINGGIMFVYSSTLLWLNCRSLPKPLRPSPFRRFALAWGIVFYGFFAVWAVRSGLSGI